MQWSGVNGTYSLSRLLGARNVDSDILFHRADLPRHEREEYINAVKCLQALPPKDDKAPGSRSRFDDFTATNIRNHNETTKDVGVKRLEYHPTFSNGISVLNANPH